VNDMMLGYSFILSGDGYPCVFWWDYFNCELARPRTPNGIDALIDAHHRYAGGESLSCMPILTCILCSATEPRRRAAWSMC
jgi:hypothetical protein